MGRFLIGMLLLLYILTGCQSTPNDEEAGLELSQEQLDRLLQSQVAKAGPKQVSFPQIIAQMQGTLAQQPGDTALLYGLGKVHYQYYLEDSNQQLLQQCVDYYTQVLQIDPQYEEGRAYYNRMLARLALGAYDPALEDLEAFVQTNAGRTPVNHQSMQAELLYQKGELEQACAVFAAAQTVAEEEGLPIDQPERWKTRCPK